MTAPLTTAERAALREAAEKGKANQHEHSWTGDTDENGQKVGYECDHMPEECGLSALLTALGGDDPNPANDRTPSTILSLLDENEELRKHLRNTVAIIDAISPLESDDALDAARAALSEEVKEETNG
ncbi:MAG: hypothetical protein KGI98_15625 [Euryarchaeota archaeon]|nr:hypothetical protein [Euryarchaeota archaeon]